MPKIPEHNFHVSELMEEKLYAFEYRWHTNDGWFIDTRYVTDHNNIGDAFEEADKWCDSQLEDDKTGWDTYEILKIMQVDNK